MTDEATRMLSHNRLGEAATRTREETVTRLQAKIVKNRGAANRQRIKARITVQEALGA